MRAFVAVAEELHFGRAAARLYVKPSTLSEQVRRLEHELATPLFLRTTRRVELTEAGDLLLRRSRTILGMTEATEEAVAALAAGTLGRLKVGMTPPVGPALMPHIVAEVSRHAPGLELETHRMWLPDLGSALLAGEIDVAVTCHRIPDRTKRTMTVEVGSEQLFVGLREDHPLAGDATANLEVLADTTLGIHRQQLFPAWHAAQLVALAEAGVDPPRVELADADLRASSWTEQAEIDWILLIGSLGRPNATAMLPIFPVRHIPFTMSWLAYRSGLPSIRRLADVVMRAGPPEGWSAPGSERHRMGGSVAE